MGITAACMVPHPPLIIPEVGRGEEKKIQHTIDAYEETARRIGEWEPETIVLLSPHQTMYADYFHISPGEGASGDFGAFRADQVKLEVSYDTDFVDLLCQFAQGENLRAGTLGEREKKLDHGTMVPLYFINKYWTAYRLVRIGLSGLPLAEHYRLGQYIQRVSALLERRTVVVGSGDLSHRLLEDGPYGYQKEGPEYDRRIMEVMGNSDFLKLLEFPEDFCQKAGECGHRSFTILAGTLDGLQVKSERLSYEGPFGVGYGVCVYEAGEKDPSRNFLKQYEEKVRLRLKERREREDAYVRLARETIEYYVRTGRLPKLPEGLAEELCAHRAGVFVSIKKDGQLRGCIGTIQAVQASIAEEIRHNAVSACSQDPRFSPVQPDELERLTVSVDVLGDTEPIASPAELDVKRYGVIVTNGFRRGLLLPNLEGVDTVESQIAIAKQKAGIRADEEVKLLRFEVVRHV